jgi:hypothetical protein
VDILEASGAFDPGSNPGRGVRLFSDVFVLDLNIYKKWFLDFPGKPDFIDSVKNYSTGFFFSAATSRTTASWISCM